MQHAGSQFPDQGSNPGPLHWECRVLTTGPQKKAPELGVFHFVLKNAMFWDFPGAPVVKNPLCNAGNTGSIPGRVTKILHTTEQPRQSATATE